jgi:hypothetical protein
MSLKQTGNRWIQRQTIGSELDATFTEPSDRMRVPLRRWSSIVHLGDVGIVVRVGVDSDDDGDVHVTRVANEVVHFFAVRPARRQVFSGRVWRSDRQKGLDPWVSGKGNNESQTFDRPRSGIRGGKRTENRVRFRKKIARRECHCGLGP